MANEEHLAILNQGVDAWNEWREENPEIQPDLVGAKLSGLDLRGIKFSSQYLVISHMGPTNEPVRASGYFNAANLTIADLRLVDLRGAQLRGTNLSGADLSRADLSYAWLDEVNLRRANLTEARLIRTNLEGAQLLNTNIENAEFADCLIHGISVWNIQGQPKKQLNLIITRHDEPVITVDNLEVAQFIYLLLNNQKIRDVINTITTKAVLILGRFTPERKAVLDAIREELRKRNYLPVLFDFDIPSDRDITETVTLLARMARFIIADLTEPSSIPKELEAIVPTLAVPVQPLLEGSTRPYSMFKDYWKYDWVLEVHRYQGLNDLLASLKEKVIAPAEAKVKELEKRRNEVSP